MFEIAGVLILLLLALLWLPYIQKTTKHGAPFVVKRLSHRP